MGVIEMCAVAIVAMQGAAMLFVVVGALLKGAVRVLRKPGQIDRVREDIYELREEVDLLALAVGYERYDSSPWGLPCWRKKEKKRRGNNA